MKIFFTIAIISSIALSLISSDTHGAVGWALSASLFYNLYRALSFIRDLDATAEAVNVEHRGDIFKP